MMHVEGGTLIRRFARIAHADARRAWTEREGIVLVLRASGMIGLGEASPLPGYSVDDLPTCSNELERCWERLPAIDVAQPIRDILRHAVARSGVRAAAAVFALESAVLDLVAKARRQPAWVTLRGDTDVTPIPLSAIAEGAAPEALAEAAQSAHARGITVVKIKVGGPEGHVRDGHRLAAVRARLGQRVALRLDANQTLPVDQLSETIGALASFGPQLLEEAAPLEHLSALRESPIPLALDESLMLDGWPERIATAAALGTFAAVVLKPMTLGGFERCLGIAAAARAARLGVIVTHVFDGPIGSAAAACLALALPEGVLPCGLDAHGRLEHRVASISETHVVPFTIEGLGVDDAALTYDEPRRS